MTPVTYTHKGRVNLVLVPDSSSIFIKIIKYSYSLVLAQVSGGLKDRTYVHSHEPLTVRRGKGELAASGHYLTVLGDFSLAVEALQGQVGVVLVLT